MSETIVQARRDVHQAFSTLVLLADNDEAQRFHGVEGRLWKGLLALGRALVVLFLARQAARPRSVDYRQGGVRFYLEDWRTSDLGTRFGKVSFTRPIGRRHGKRRAAADLPVDRELGLSGGFSLGVVLEIARLYAVMSYAVARGEFERMHDWAPSPRAAMRMVDAVGARARSFIEERPAPSDDGEVLVIQVDAGGAPMISKKEDEKRRRPKRASAATRQERRRGRHTDPKTRRGPGEKSKNAKMAVVAVIYTLRATPDGLDGPVDKRLFATFESHDALFAWLRKEADKRGYGTKKTIFLADGCEHIWRCQQLYFPQAECCLDWFHLTEYLWKAGRVLYKSGNKKKAKKIKNALAKWVKDQTTRLRAGDIDAIVSDLQARLDATPKTGPGNKSRRETLEKVLGYFDTHRGRIPYASFIARDFDIGSGAIEGGIRNLVRMRFDGPGMRWGRQRSEFLLQLRCIVLNGQWDDLVDRLAAGDAIPLAAKPEPARPHAAKKKAA